MLVVTRRLRIPLAEFRFSITRSNSNLVGEVVLKHNLLAGSAGAAICLTRLSPSG
jgi:hypothetical protein